MRSHNLMRELARRGWRVSLMSLMPGERVGHDDRARLEALCEGVQLEPFEPGRTRYLGVAAALLRGEAFQRRYFYSPAAAARLRSWLARESFDVIVAGQLYMYPYVPEDRLGATVLDCHNVELQRVERMAEVGGLRPRGLAARLQIGAVARMELEAVERSAAVLAVSEPDRRHFAALTPQPVSLVPNGVDCERILPRGSLPGSGILFLGAMDYGANVDGVMQLIDEVLPRLQSPRARLEVVGSNPPRSIHAAAARASVPVEIAGRVPSTEPSFERNRLLAVPLRIGGGTRLKILESLARGVPVVTTAIGCEGLGLTHGRDAIIADEPEELARWIDRLLEDDELCLGLAREGRRLVESRFDWRLIGETLDAALKAAAA